MHKRSEGESAGRVEWMATFQNDSESSSDVRLWDSTTDKKTGGRAENAELFIGSDQNGQD